jgi:osmoprotectant transport system permease protein
MQVLGWLTDPANWSGPNSIPIRLFQHIEMSVVALVIACLIAVPLGLLVGHTRRGGFFAISTANVGRAIPSFALLVLVFVVVSRVAPSLAFGFVPTVIALTCLAIPPILTNTTVGIEQVDADSVDAARGMGLSGRQILTRLEIPLATPLIVAGLRTAAVQVVATATLAALIAGGGLGRFIVDGIALGTLGVPQLVGGAILVAALAIVTEMAFSLLGRAVRPRTSSASSAGHPRVAST